MHIKSPHKVKVRSGGIRRVLKSRLFRWTKRVVLLGFIGVVFAAGIYVGIKMNTGRGYEPKVLIDKMLGRVNSPSFAHGFEAVASSGESANINIKFENLQQINFERANALKGNKAFQYVTATIDYNGETIPVKLKLKGDRPVHWEDPEQMSFRVKTKGENTFMGMKKFSLQKPRVKNYVYEWIFHKALEREDILALRYKFITLSVNGNELGTYAVEEHFEKRLVESQERREGPIIRMVEGAGHTFYSAPIVPYDADKWATGNRLEAVNKATQMFDGWRRGELTTSQVFDVERLAKYFAISDVLGAEHSAIWKSVKFYYNPITGKLEPIGVDAQLRWGYSVLSAEIGLRPDIGYVHDKYEDWYRHLFINEATFDSAFYNTYVTELDRMSKRGYLDQLFQDIGPELGANLNMIYKDFPIRADHITHYGPDFFRFDKNNFYDKQSYIRFLLEGNNGIHAHFAGSDSAYVYLDVANITSMPTEMGVMKLGDATFEPVGAIKVPGKHLKAGMEFQRITYKKPEMFAFYDSLASNLVIAFRHIGMQEWKAKPVYNWEYERSITTSDYLMMYDELNTDHEMIERNDSTKSFYIKRGRWTLDKDIIFPTGYTVYGGDSTIIELTNQAKIISYSPVHFVGKAEAEFVIQSSDSTGQGLFVLNADTESILRFASFINLSNPSKGAWSVYGSVNFYEADVNINNCVFDGNRSEDGLNIIRSKFHIENSVFSNSQSDAFDGDFCQGTISISIFEDLGNDAIDVSGSRIEVYNTEIRNPADKAISAGEGSEIIAKTITVSGGEIGITSKDRSYVEIDELQIDSCRVGFTSFQKKPEFGGAKIKATKVVMNGVEKDFLNEKGSELNVNGADIPPIEGKVEDFLYGAEYGKKTIR